MTSIGRAFRASDAPIRHEFESNRPEFFGYLRGEKLIGQPFAACVYADDRALVETAFADAIRQLQLCKEDC
jgi:hypothetical protein